MRLFLSEHCTCGADPEAATGPLFVEGAAMLRALAEDAAQVAGVEVVVAWADGSGPLGVDGVEVIPVSPLPPGGASSFDAVFPKLTAECDATLHIAPETGDVLARRAEQVLDAGHTWLGCRPDAIRAWGDKRQDPTRLAGLRVPVQHRPGERVLKAPLPVVVKPRFGAGGEALFFGRMGRPEGPGGGRGGGVGETVTEQFVPGRPYSVALLNNAILPPGEQDIRITGTPGVLSYHGGTVPAAGVDRGAVEHLVGQVRKAVPGLSGWWGIDFVVPDEPFAGSRDPVLIEVNPRLTTSYLGYRALTPDNLAERLIFPERAFPPLRWNDGAVSFMKDGAVTAEPRP